MSFKKNWKSITVLILIISALGLTVGLEKKIRDFNGGDAQASIEKTAQKSDINSANIADSEKALKRAQNPEEFADEDTQSGVTADEDGTVKLKVPFICQAPLETFENWKLHGESCEEASLLQAYLYEKGKTMSKEDANKEILNMIAWQESNMGGHNDLEVDAMKEFIMGYYKMRDDQVTIVKNVSIKDIEELIDQGHPIIAPVEGATLENPYYPYQGYHMLTVVGYNDDRIITNDNGTKMGESYSYSKDLFMKALRDTGKDVIILENL